VKASEMVKQLQDIIRTDGDLEVEVPVLGDTAPVDLVETYVRSHGDDVIMVMANS
jgi:hypothetical protein